MVYIKNIIKWKNIRNYLFSKKNSSKNIKNNQNRYYVLTRDIKVKLEVVIDNERKYWINIWHYWLESQNKIYYKNKNFLISPKIKIIQSK